MVEQQLLDEHPGPTDLAGGDGASSREALQGLRVDLEQPRGVAEVEGQHRSSRYLVLRIVAKLPGALGSSSSGASAK